MRQGLLQLLLIIFYAFTGTAQTKTISDLSTNVYHAAPGEQKLKAIITLCSQHSSMNKDSLLAYGRQAMRLAEQTDNAALKTDAVIVMVNAFLRFDKTDSAQQLIDPELQKLNVKDPATRNAWFVLMGQKVDCAGDAANYKDALADLYAIVKEAEIYNDSAVLAKNMNTIGVINYNLDHVPDAFNWYFKGLSYTSTEARFDAFKAALMINIAETYRWVANTDSAAYFIEQAIPLCNKSENLFFLANAIRVKASIYKQRKQYKEAEETMLECIRIREKTEGKLKFSNEQLALANIYINAGEPDKAIAIIVPALESTESKANILAISYYQSLAKSYKLKNDAKNYETTLENIISATNAFYEANSASAIAELQTKYEVQKKESTIIRQKLDLTRKNYLFYGSLLILLFAIALAFLLFKNYRRRQELKMEQALIEEKVQAELAVKAAEENERKRIAADLHDNLGAYAASIVSNLDHITAHETTTSNAVALQELRNNSQAIVAQLGDTIWAIKKDELSITAISDRLKAFIQRIKPSYPQVNIDVVEEIENDQTLPPAQAFHLFRIVQEAINNALKHSRCSYLVIDVKGKETWAIVVQDDGKGMEQAVVEASTNGLMNMRSRAGEFGWIIQWNSTGSGTQVYISPTTN